MEEGRKKENGHVRVLKKQQRIEEHEDRMAEKEAKHREAGPESRPRYIYVDANHFTWTRWFLRKIYTVVHALFASFWFYFIPFSSIVLSYRIPF